MKETGRESFNGLEVISFDSPLSAFAANAFLIMGRKEAVLVDALLLHSEGAQLAAAIRRTGRNLKYIFITHNHPDHYWGLEPIVKEFPDARVVASKNVVFQIQYTCRAKVVHWKPIFEDDIPWRPIVPTAMDSDHLLVEDHPLKLIELPPAETIFAGALYAPSIKCAFTGDLIFNRFHFYVADVNVPESWIDAVELLKAQGPISRVYPGHGAVADQSVLDWVIGYLTDYARAIEPPASKEQMMAKMRERYPDLRMPELLCCTLGPAMSSEPFKALKTLAG
jgi:glyoxylase-like metal-dependent hydrolase (beta-lactamase superfamily II)